MTFLKFAALVCASFALISGAQKREASKEVAVSIK